MFFGLRLLFFAQRSKETTRDAGEVHDLIGRILGPQVARQPTSPTEVSKHGNS